TALPADLETGVNRTIAFLQTQSSRMMLQDSRIEDGILSTTVALQNQAGHKLPTAYPSRRAWIHLRVTDRAGRIVFESGALDPNGAILGNDNDADPARYEPHYSEISHSDEVQIYEVIMGDPSGAVTTGLLTAV